MSDFESWPEEQKKAMGRVAGGIVEGDLQALADYFRSGFTEIEATLAKELADMIDSAEGFTPYKLTTVARRRGYQGWKAASEAHDHKMRVGVFMQTRLDDLGRGGYESAMRETQERFNLKERAIVNNLKYLRHYLEAGKSKSDWDHWAYIQDLYCTD